MIKLGVDLGRSEIRLHDGNTAITFPTLLGGPVSVVRRGGLTLSREELERNLQITVDGETYSLGKFALNQPFLLPVGIQDFASDLNQVLLLGALGLYASHLGRTDLEVQLCIGIPVCLAEHEESLDAIKQWQGTHRFELCGHEFTVAIAQIEVMPQPLGALYTALLNGQLEYSPEALVGIVDLGFAGSGWVVSQLPGELVQYSGFSPNLAGNRLVDQLTSELLKQGIPQVTPLAALQALETGEYRHGGKSYPIDTKTQENILNLMAQQIALTLQQRWQPLEIDTLLVTGGLGEQLFSRLQKQPYFADAVLLENARLANATGYSEYLNALGDEEGPELPQEELELTESIPEVPTDSITEADTEV